VSSQSSKPNFPVMALVWLVIALILTAVSPAELTLGSSVKLVFLHAALMWVGFIGYTGTGLLSVVSLVRKSSSGSAWADSILQVATVILVSTGLLGIVTASLTWGGVVWGEPRLQMLAKILLLSFGTLFASRLATIQAQNILRILLTGGVWYLLLSTERIVHPVNPIFTSGNIAMMLFPLVIAACILLAAYTTAAWLHERAAQDRSTQKKPA